MPRAGEIREAGAFAGVQTDAAVERAGALGGEGDGGRRRGRLLHPPLPALPQAPRSAPHPPPTATQEVSLDFAVYHCL